MTMPFALWCRLLDPHTPFDATQCLVLGIPLPMLMSQGVASAIHVFYFLANGDGQRYRNHADRQQRPCGLHQLLARGSVAHTEC